MGIRTNIKKFSIYEFDMDIGDKDLICKVIYKKNDEDFTKSIIEGKIVDNNGEIKNTFSIPASIFHALYESLNEIDPYAFVFSQFDEKDK